MFADPFVFVKAELKLERRRNLFHFAGIAQPYNDAGNGWVMQRPCHGHHAGAYSVSVTDLAQQLYQAQVKAQARFLKLGVAVPPVALRQCAFQKPVMLQGTAPFAPYQNPTYLTSPKVSGPWPYSTVRFRFRRSQRSLRCSRSSGHPGRLCRHSWSG